MAVSILCVMPPIMLLPPKWFFGRPGSAALPQATPFEQRAADYPVLSRSHGLNSRLKRLDRLVVSLPDAAAGDDSRSSRIKLTPSNAAPAIGREHRLND